MDDLAVASRAAHAAADAIRRSADSVAEYKGPVDPVTEADRQAEAAIVDVLHAERPDDGILTEEGSDAESASGRRWVVDPLDGTVNFVHGIPHVAVSVGLEADGATIVGVVLDVFRDELFAAQVGSGATVNGSPIAVSETSDVRRSLLVTGFPYDRHERAREYTDVVAAVLERAQGVRRLGSAALDLAWVACGRFDGYWEVKLAPWDIAAGRLLVTEAGGFVTAWDGGEASHREILATNGRIHAAVMAVIGAPR